MISRKEFVRRSLLVALSTAMLPEVGARAGNGHHGILRKSALDFPVNIFSKNLHWLGYEDMARVAAEMGFDGVDLTVRPDGHVEPARVKEDLPKAVEAIRNAGLEVYMITTGLQSMYSPLAEDILATASQLQIPFYRMGWMNYDDKLDIPANLKSFKQNLVGLASLNEKHKICGDYQNHSGSSFGSPVWDLSQLLQDMNPSWIGSQYDILHAVVEGANSWPLGLKSLMSYVHTMDIKDFRWQKNETGWKAEVVPLGEGMVDFQKFLSLLKMYQIKGPFSMHFEYPLGGAESGARQITLPREQVLTAMRRDLLRFREMLKQAGISKG